MVNHRGPEFAALLREATAGLKECFRTANDLLLLTASGSGALEAAIVNTLSPGDRVLAVSIGAFGDRWAQIARAFGLDVVKLDFPWGSAAEPGAIGAALRDDPAIKAVLVTHSETSTGVANDLAAISSEVGRSQALLLVDAISSAGALPLESDAWGLDVVVGCSQKAFMAPPGLSMVTMSERAWAAYAGARLPRAYWDLGSAKKNLEKGQTPWTPAVSVLYALVESLNLIAAEGLENVIARHRRVGVRMRDHVRALGLSLLVKDAAHAADTTTAIVAPEGIDAAKLLRVLREEHGVVLAGGQGQLAGKIVRVGHVGWVNEEDIDAVAESLRLALTEQGWRAGS
jgi:aspartate aminotransferase-like enzyme